MTCNRLVTRARRVEWLALIGALHAAVACAPAGTRAPLPAAQSNVVAPPPVQAIDAGANPRGTQGAQTTAGTNGAGTNGAGTNSTASGAGGATAGGVGGASTLAAGTPANSAVPGGTGATSDPSGGPKPGCPPRMVAPGDPQLHFHHVHFNTTDPDKDVEFFVKFFNEKAIDFCVDAVTNQPTHAVQAGRGYFLFTKVTQPADPKLNSFLEHVGYLSPNVMGELMRMNGLGVPLPLWPAGDNLQCTDVTKGTVCFNNGYFYMQAPSGARIEISHEPNPPTSGFGHLHLRGPVPDFFMTVLGPALKGMIDPMRKTAPTVDDVNLTNAYLENSAPTDPVDTKDKPISHFAYSTTDLKATLDRIKAAGIQIQDDVSFKPEFGFKSFFIKSPQGVWVEIVEDSQFKQTLPP